MTAGAEILLVDRSPLVEAGLKDILADTPLKVAERVADPAAAIQWLAAHRCALVVSEFVPDDNRFQSMLKACRDRRAPWVILSSSDNPGLLARAKRDGARGWISRYSTATQIRHSLQAAVQGRPAWSAIQSRRLRAAMISPRLAHHPYFPLTGRELQVLQLAGEGHSNRRIAEKLDIAFETAKEHMRHVLGKLRVADRTRAAVRAERAGILRDRRGDPPPG